MKKKTLLIAIPMILMLLAGCAGKAAPETESPVLSESTEATEDTHEEITHPDISSSQEVIPDESQESEMPGSVDNLAEEIKPEVDTSQAAAEELSKPKEEPSQPASQSEEIRSEPPAPSSDTETNDNTPIAEQTEPQESSSQPVTEPEAPGEPVVTEPEAKPEPEPEPQPEPEPSFDIDYWVSYARGVATEKGLALDAEATECWDNPITANPGCIYLERDINDAVNRLVRTGFTSVWVWYESVGNNKYLIYFGYA